MKTFVEKSNMDWAKLDSICKDGCPAMIGIHAGCLALLKQFFKRPLLKYHCIMHQESLCGKSLELKHVMDVMIKCVNEVRERALNRHEFRVSS